MPGLGWSQEQLKSLDRTLGTRQESGLRPVTPSLPETDDERAARIKRDSLMAIMSMPEPLRSQQLAGAQYEPGFYDYLNQGAGSFMRALGTGIGALPKAGAVAVEAANRLVPIYVPGVSSPSNSVFDSPAYHYGEDVAKRIGDVGPLPVTELQDSFVATTLPSAAASVATTALPALIPGVGPAIGAASGAAQQSVSELERAVKDGQTESDALGAFIPNALIGVYDILPGMVARKALTGAATRELGGGLLGSTLRAAGKAGVTEGAQEFGQNIASDVVSGYRPIDIPGALEAGAAGLITGGALGGGANLAGRAIGRLTPLKPSQQDGMVTSPTISEKIELTPDQMANLARKNATAAGLTRSPQSVAQDFGLQTPDQQQNFANKNAYDAGLSRNPTDVAQTLELPANAHLVNEQGAPIEQAPTPPLVQTPQPQPITAQPASNLPAIDAPTDVLRQDVPDISKVAAARIQNLAETKPQADGRVTRVAPLNTPIAELQRYYESYGVPFHARREGLGWRLTIDPLAQTREQTLDPRDVMDQINYAAEQGIRQRGVPNDQQPVRGPDAIAPEVQPAITEPIQPTVKPEPQSPQAQAQDSQVLKDELSTLAAKARRGLLLARDRRTIPQRMAQLQNTLINDYAIDPTEIDAIVGGEPITPRVPISEITNEGQTVPTEVQQPGQGQIQQANAAEAPPIEGRQVGQDVRLRLAQPTVDSTLGPGGQTEGIPAPQPKGNLFQRSRNRLARAAAQQELAAQQQIASQQTEQTTEQPAETVQRDKPLIDVFAEYSPEFSKLANETNPEKIGQYFRGVPGAIDSGTLAPPFSSDVKSAAVTTAISYDDLEPLRDAVTNMRKGNTLDADILLRRAYKASEGKFPSSKMYGNMEEAIGDLLPNDAVKFTYHLWEESRKANYSLKQKADVVVGVVFGDRLNKVGQQGPTSTETVQQAQDTVEAPSEERLYKFRGQQTVQWYSDKTGRKMKPGTRPITTQVRATSIDEARAKIRADLESRVTTAQKRDLLTIEGKITEIGKKPGRAFAEILSESDINSTTTSDTRSTNTVTTAQDRLGVPQEDRQRIASVTESLPENQRDAAALALTEGRPSDISTITATPEDVSQAANISTFAEPDAETATVSLPEPDTEIAPDTPIETKLVPKDEANAAFNRIAKKLTGKVFANPVGPIFDPEIWADVSKIAVHYSEYYARAGLAGAQSGYRAFAKYMRESLNGVTVNIGGHDVSLGDFFVGANGGSDAKRLYAETKSKLVRERKALAGSLQRQRVAASEAMKAQGITSSISRNLSKLKETKLHSGFKDMLKQAGISFAFTKGDRLGDRLSMYSAAVERAIGDRIDPVLIRQLNQSDGKLSNLSVADLAQINNVLKSFKKLNSDFATDVAGSYINVRDDYATKAIDEIKAYKPNEAADTAIEHVREKLGYYGGTLFDIPYTLIRSFVGGKNGTTMQKLLYDNLIDGERKALGHVVDYIKAFDSLTRQYKMHDPVAISEFSSTMRDYTLDGKKVKLTEGDLLYLYMIAQSPDARQRVIGSKVVRRANREFTSRSIEVTEQLLSDVEKTATPFMKDFAEIAFSNKADLYPAMNAAVKETTGHDVGYTGDRHVDLHTTDAQKDKGLPEIVNFASQTSLERSGIIQGREGGNNVYVLDNGIGMHMAWLKRATDIAYKLVPGRMAMAVLEKPDVRESIVSRWGRENYNVLLEQTRQMTGLLEPERSAALSRTASAARWMAHLYGGGRLAFRPTSVMQQYSGALLAMAEMSTSEKLHMPEAHLINPILTESDRAKVAHNPYLDFRIHQNNGRGFYEPSDIGEFEAASRATTAYLREIRDIGFLPITLGDNAVIKMAWTAVEGANPRKANESDTAYYTRIGERVEHIIRTTQNPVLSSDMTHIHRSSRRTAWGPFTFMLTSSSAAMRNVFVRAVQEGDLTKATVAAVSLLSATAITTLHGLAVYGVYGRDEEEKRNNLLKTIATRIGGDIVNTAAPGVGGEVAGLISSVIKGITPDDRSPLGALSGSAIRTISAFKAENPNPHAKGAAFARFASNLMPLFGLPSYPLELASGVLGQMSRKQRSGSLLPQLKGGPKGGQLKGLLGG